MFFNVEATPDKIKPLLFELTKANEPVAPIDDFQLIRTVREHTLLTDEELMRLPEGSAMILDAEIFPNYSLFSFKHCESGKFLRFEQAWDYDIYLDRMKLMWVMKQFLTVGFNSNLYDIPMIQLATVGYGPTFLKEASNWIILDAEWINPRTYFEIAQKYDLPEHKFNHIDLRKVVPLKGSLKLYAGRLHCKRMQDLPYHEATNLTLEQISQVRSYNVNDLDNTELILDEVKPQIDLRYAMGNIYGVDVRSKSDAQIAESVVNSEIYRIKAYKSKYPKIDPGTEYRYKVPKFLRFETPLLQKVLDTVVRSRYVVNEKGSIDMPAIFEEFDIKIGQCTYTMQIGGLHSNESSVCHLADNDTLLIDRDVKSYYPMIIINTELYPHHLGKDFLTVYKGLVQRRLDAKKAGDLVYADTLKITVNGTFGKLGNKYSSMYAPDRILHVLITGQLSLLMLIEMIELAGISVISANTDGVMIKCSKRNVELLNSIVKLWETATGFDTESNQYKAIYSRDVNNYIAIGTDGKAKVKGTYAEKGSSGNTVLSKNPESMVCNDAIIALLTNSIPIEDTIRNCSDIRRFITLRNVTGGATKSGIPIGKTIRWYFSTNCKGEINYVKSGNKVPNTDGAMPVMELPDQLPSDIDYDRYIRIANDILVDIAYTPKPAKAENMRLFG